ncbi:TlyA family RNA methyltransferase [Roseateles sp. DAIF2]|uniref:TlyA family RNA methyltransferase n=1 Tax=Roseateles sp. DAIF2 TaxID=2714952 RepID=UPI0018A31854|nr:TlyA family RNA methyltransferase [Roseateles sp. DAIF2]QPF72327.1 TlyA family RNA methyltransferase [Roseateles sp. DAIF2]
MRADQLLVAQGLAPTRSAAQRLIDSGAVQCAGRVLKKAGEDLLPDTQLVVTDDAELRYVSRGGLKLEGALKTSGLDVAGLHALDIGQSTGGFTDVLLKAGAAHVTGIDVGHSQLHASLREDARVTALENTHVREYVPGQTFALIVGDLSFISMLGELARIAPWLAPAGHLLLLIKPQFELGKKALNKGGLIKDRKQYAELEQRAKAAVDAIGSLQQRGWFESPVTGGDGNTEFFLWVQAT